MNTKAQTPNLRTTNGATPQLVFGRVRNQLLTLVMLAVLSMTTSLRADRVGHDISAGYIKIDQGLPGFYDNTNATAALLMSVNGFSVVSNVVNMGDYRVQIGSSAADDTNAGVIMVSPAQNGRANWMNGVGAFTNNFQTPAVIPYGAGYWEAGIFRCPPNSSTTANQGEDNVDVTVAYFPFSTWRGGYGLNGANGLELTNFIASPGLVLGTHFRDYWTNSAISDAVANGVYYLDLRPFGIDSRRDGILLVNHAKNEANYALSRVNNDDDEMDGTWTIYTHDNRANGRSYEQDPVAFVFVPKSDTTIVSGMFMGDAAIAIHSGTSPAFTVTNFSTGQYELKIPGRSPNDGILIVSPAGGDANNGDNIVTFARNTAGTGWIIQSRDLPACGLQTPPDTEAVCSFVFIPAEQPGVTVTPTANLQTTESGGTTNFTVTINGYPKMTNNVVINVSSSDTAEGTISPPTLTFTPADWNVPQTVTITGVDDGVADGTKPYNVNLSTTTSSDLSYNGLVAGSVSAINFDNEPGVVSVDASSATTTEAGGTSTFRVWLTSEPTGDVTVPISSSDTSEATVSTANLTFTSLDYGVPQFVTVTGVNDDVQDGNIAYTVVVGAATSTDGAYNGFNALDIAGVNLDNDLARVIVPAGKLTVTEPNTTAQFALVLGSEPTANVTINCASSDTSEGTVTPSVTFTPANWSTPQNVTVTAADDFINDGTIDFTIITTVSSTDPIYAAINPDDVSVATVDNEAAFTLPSGIFNYGLGESAKGIDGYATVSDADTADYNGGSLTVTVTAAGTASDRLDVRNIGTGAGQIGVAGTTVSYEGVAIGTKSGGVGLTPLAITFTSASATPAAAQALARAISYQNVDATAAPQSRTLSFALADGDGGVSTVGKSITLRLMRIDSYQQDADGGFGVFTNALDTQIHHEFPSTAYPAGYSTAGLWIDYDPASLIPTDQMQCFVKFTNLIGNAAGQIPLNAKIVFAELILNVADSGHGARFNRMLGDWDESVTFDFLGNGIQLDDIEAVSGTNAFLSDEAANTTTGGGLRVVGVTSDVQAWANGANNYGWVMSTWTNGANGTAFSPCEATNIVLRPRLRVGWLPTSTSVASFQQGVSGYTGTVDTQVRLAAPTTSFAANTVLAPDWLVNATPVPNQNQVLIRFDNIIGSGAGQVPAGSRIHAAILELTSINADAQGAGGQFHAVLKSWNAADTWNTWVNGVDTDGIEAAVAPTVTLPVAGLGETVQPTKHNIEITADVQAWASGVLANNGWAIMPWPNGNNGWAFNAADEARVDMHPLLRIYYSPAPVITSITRGATSATLNLTGPASTGFTVWRSTTVNGTYVNIGTGAFTGGGTGTFLDNTAPAGSAFYKASIP